MQRRGDGIALHHRTSLVFTDSSDAYLLEHSRQRSIDSVDDHSERA